MGRSIALTLAREGASVVVNYRTSQAAAEEIVAHIAGRGGQALAVGADVFTADGCRKLVDTAITKFGRVDICVINPGAGWHPEKPHELAAEGALQDAAAELAPIYHLLPLVLPGMYERKWGRLVGISLAAADSPSYAYNVAKAARTQALLQLRKPASKHGVTVNVIAPGEVEAIANFAAAIEQCDRGAARQERTKISPQDIAEGVTFLCSEAGRFVNGTELNY